jgi:hypothetical protein
MRVHISAGLDMAGLRKRRQIAAAIDETTSSNHDLGVSQHPAAFPIGQSGFVNSPTAHRGQDQLALR